MRQTGDISITPRFSMPQMVTAMRIAAQRPRAVPPPAIIDHECNVVSILFEARRRRLLVVVRADESLAFRGIDTRDRSLYIEGEQVSADKIDWLWMWIDRERT